jgi:nucleolar protein 12
MEEFNKDVLSMFSKSFPTPAPIQAKPISVKKSKRKEETVPEANSETQPDSAWLQPYERGLKRKEKNEKIANTGISPKKHADDDMTTDATDILDDVALKKDKSHEMDRIINNTQADPEPIQKKKQLPTYVKMQQKKRTVFVGNVPFATTEKEIKKLFKTAGEISSIRFRNIPFLATDKFVSFHAKRTDEDLIKGFDTKTCYVVYKDVNSVAEAIKLNNTLIGNKHIHVDIEKKASSKDVSHCVFVGNIPFKVEDEQIREHFSQFGEIDYVRVIRDKATRKTKGFCYVNFVNKRGYTLALSRSDQTTIEGRLLRIGVAQEGAVDTRKNGNVIKPDGSVKRDYRANNNAANPYLKSNMNQVLEKKQRDKKPRENRKPRDKSGERFIARHGAKVEEVENRKREKKVKKERKELSKSDLQKKEKKELKRKRASLEKKFKRTLSEKNSKNGSGKKPPKKKSRSA